MFSYALKSLRANLTRFVSTSLAIILGISFLAAGLMLTDAVKVGLTGNVEERYRNVDLAVVSSDRSQEFSLNQGVPIELLGTIRNTDGVAAAAPEIQADVRVLDHDGTPVSLRTIGRNWIPDDKLNPLELTEGRGPTADGQVVLSADLARSAGARVGTTVDLETPIGPVEVTVTGISRFGTADALDDGGTVSFAEDQAITVLNTGASGVTDTIIRTAREPSLVSAQLARTLPKSVAVMTRAQFIEDATRSTVAFIDFLRPVLQGFAYLAMFVSGFVIFNTFSVIVTQRFRELALIRAIGGTPKQVRRSLLTEGAAIGLGASAIGVVLGTFLAKGLQVVLRAFDLSLPGNGVSITPGTVALCMVIGLVVTVLAIAVPAFRAGRTKPVEAMRDSAVDTSGTSKVRAVAGGSFLGLGVLLLIANQTTGPKWFFLTPGGFLLFTGLFIGGPLLARLFATVVRPVVGRFGLTGQLAVDNVARNPRRTATTANALVIGLFLVTLVTVSGGALKTAVVDELNKLSSSDFIVASNTAIAPDLVRAIDGVRGVTNTAPVRGAAVTSTDGLATYISTVDLDRLADTTGAKVTEGSIDDILTGNGAATIDISSLGDSSFGSSGGPTRLGDTETFTGLDGSPVEVRIVALFEAKLDALSLGTLVGPETFDRIVGDKPVTHMFVRVEPGRADEVGVRIEKAIRGYTGVEIMSGNVIGQTVGRVFDFLIGAVNALLAMSVIVALVGIVNTMTLAIFERRRELGLVRALGMTRRQVGRMVRGEALLMGTMGTLIGMTTGIALSWVLISSIPEADIGLSVNWARVAVILVIGLLVGVVASIVPARRATRLDMLEAIQSE